MDGLLFQVALAFVQKGLVGVVELLAVGAGVYFAVLFVAP